MVRKAVLGITLLSLLTTLTFSMIVSVEALGTSMSVINPSTGGNSFIFYTNTTGVGFRFNATIWAYNVVDLYSFQVYLTVNDTLLNISRTWLPWWDPQYVFFGRPRVTPAPIFYDSDGDGSREALLIGDMLLSGPGFTGTGKLVIVEFEIIYAPTIGKVSSALNINNFDTFLRDSNLFEIPAIKTSGYYEYNYVGPVHDVAITNVEVGRTAVGQGNSTSINVTVENQGGYTETFNVTTYANTTIIQTKNVTLESDVSTTINFTWNTAGIALGNYTIKAIADTVPGEADTADNTYIDGIVTVRLPIHDVAVVDVMPSKTIVGQNFFLPIRVTVENQGDFNETVSITVFLNDTENLSTKQLSLIGGELTTIQFDFNTTGFAKGNYTVKATVKVVLGELETADNNFTDGWVIIAMVGDITGPDGWPDGKCDIRDIAQVARRFGTSPWHPLWNPNCDITGPIAGLPDEKIDIRDIALVAKHFGEIDP